MNPSNFALDILVVGLGQGGGNLAGEFHRRGYRALALNTAQADLRSLDAGSVNAPSVPEELRMNIGLPGYDGAGADPEFGRKCIRAHADDILDEVIKQSEGADMILIVAGLGGGTGSSLSELVDVLADQELPLLALGTIPMRGENAIVKVNAVRAIHELAQSTVRTFMVVDNARADELVRDVPMADYYSSMNAAIVDPLDGLNRLNSREDLHSLRSFDGEEFRKLLLAGGVMNYGTATIDQLTLEDLNEGVQHCLRAGELMPPGFEPSAMSYIALVIEASEETLAKVPMSVIDHFHQHWKNATDGAAIEVAIYSSSEASYPTKLRLIAVSPSLPLEIQELVLEASREATAVRAKLRQDVGGIDVSGLDGLSILPHINRAGAKSKSTAAKAERANDAAANEAKGSVATKAAADTKTASRKDTKSSFERKASVELKAPEEAKSEAERRPSTELRTKLASKEEKKAKSPVPSLGKKKTFGTTRSGVTPGRVDGKKKTNGASDKARAESVSEATPPIDQLDLPRREGSVLSLAPPPNMAAEAPTNPEVYEQLIEDFRGTSSDQIRREIADRLENDRFSEHATVRFYVVQAMSKLDKQLFESSLIAATEDENESVRSIATRALSN